MKGRRWLTSVFAGTFERLAPKISKAAGVVISPKVFIIMPGVPTSQTPSKASINAAKQEMSVGLTSCLEHSLSCWAALLEWFCESMRMPTVKQRMLNGILKMEAYSTDCWPKTAAHKGKPRKPVLPNTVMKR